MIQHSQTITNSRGDALAGFRCQVVTSAGAIVDIFADKSGTRFRDAAGNIVNYALAESTPGGKAGRATFYFTPATGQVLQVLDPAGTLVDTDPDFADKFVITNLPGELATAAVTGLDAALASKVATADLASTDLAKGAALVALQQGGDVQDAIKFVTLEMFGAVGDGVTDDVAAINAALATGLDVGVTAKTFLTSGNHALLSNQRVFALETGARIHGTCATGYTFQTQGFPSATIATLTSVVTVDPYVWTLTFDTTANMTVGMPILLHDPITEQFEVNVVDEIVTNSIACKWPILQPFPVPSRVLVRSLNPIVNARIEGLKLTGEGALGGLVQFLYTDNCGLVDCELGPSEYIGVAIESSIFPYSERNRINNTGASGYGYRNARGFRSDFDTTIKTPRSDEPFTVYFNSGPGRFMGCDAVGELFGSPGAQGNSFLIDTRNAFIDIIGCSGEGSRTYHVLITGSDATGAFSMCRDINVVGGRWGRANLGHVKVENSKRVLVDDNACANVVDAIDSIEGGIATASIRVKAGCSDCFVGPGNRFSGLAGLSIMDSQAAPAKGFMSRLGVGTVSPYGTFDVRGSHTVTSQDFVAGSVGSAFAISLGAATGNTFGQINVGNNGDNDTGFLTLMRFGGGVGIGRTSSVSGGLLEVNGRLVQSLSPAAPALALNSDMAMQLVDNTTLRIHVRGTDGVTRTNTLTLA